MDAQDGAARAPGRSLFFWFCLLLNAALVTSALLEQAFSLQILLLFVGIVWMGIVVVSLLVWASGYNEPERRPWEPFALCCAAFLLLFPCANVAEHLAWMLKKSTMQRAAERIAREHPQEGDALLRPDECWILNSSEGGTVHVHRYGKNWTVLFVTSDTLFSGFRGYLYTSADASPGEPLHEGSYLEALERKAPRWFYCDSPNGWD